MSSLAHRLPIFVGAALLALAACSPAAGSQPDDSPARASGATCQPDNLTGPCACADGRAGRRTCASGLFGACECEAPSLSGLGGPGGGDAGATHAATMDFAGNGRTDITFEWQSVAAPQDDGSCPPGEYEGNLQGVYYSVLNPTPIGLPIANLDPPGAPSGFHFVLAPAQGGETVQKVQGEVDGLADGLFPFKAQIDGELNCRTATFTGRLYAGTYSILVDGLLPQQFEGVANAHYDKRTHTFVNGTWDVAETTATPPGKLAPSLPRDFARDGYGGSGDFAAALPTDPNDPSVTTCPGSGFTCGASVLGPNKLLCNNALGTPTCFTDADCAPQFPGENVPCLKASLFSLCLRECKK